MLLGRLRNPEEVFDKVVSGEIKEPNIYFTEDGQGYIVGIIDILTEYNGKKRLEYIYKRMKYGKTMSCIPPDQYAERFTNFMKRIIHTEVLKKDRSNE